jgi:D-serine deaminase-like pyridoxal phosphate-dependent protein
MKGQKTVTSVAVFYFNKMKFERPAYLINPDTCKENIRTMAEKASRSEVVFRPHFKTHQSLAIGHWFRQAGITRITVSSLIAAEYFALDGWDDITIAFPVNLREIDLINRLSSKLRIGLLLEHPAVAIELERQLKFPADVYIKIDTGYHRTGLTMDDMLHIQDLAGVVGESSHLRLKGLLTHAGHTYQAKSAAEIRQIYHSSTQILKTVRDNLNDRYRQLILSYGDTPSCCVMESFSEIDEIRPGNFIFYDLMQMYAGVCHHSMVAGIVVCPVVAVHQLRNQAVLYGGAIHLSKESVLLNDRRIYGQMVEMDEKGWYSPIAGSYLVSLSQEHGILEAPESVIRDLRPGKVVGIIPVHSCLTANLLKGYQFLDGGVGDYFPGI